MKYREQYREMYYMGDMLYPHLEDIVRLVKETNAQSLLDFGCGRGKQYTNWGSLNASTQLGIVPSLYDPGVKKFEKMPSGTFDGVYSTDVMEHIPKEELPETFELIFNKAQKFVFLAICTRPAINLLPNGENAHCTLEKIDWWTEQVSKYRPSNILTHLRTYGHPESGGICNSYEVLK